MSTDLVIYQPTQAQRLAKARLHAALEGSWKQPESMSIDQLCNLAGTTTLKKWLSDPSCAAWFFNSDVARHKIQATAELAVDGLDEILRAPVSQEITASNKIAAAALVLKMAGLTPATKIEQKNTNGVAEMSPDQLKEFLLVNVRKLIKTLPQAEKEDLLNVLTIDQ